MNIFLRMFYWLRYEIKLGFSVITCALNRILEFTKMASHTQKKTEQLNVPDTEDMLNVINYAHKLIKKRENEPSYNAFGHAYRLIQAAYDTLNDVAVHVCYNASGKEKREITIIREIFQK